MDRDALLRFYGQLWDPEAGPFNLSVEGKYLEYIVTRFFEENFNVPEGEDICNIGIGAGFWDRYLSYRLRGGTLTSVDRLPECCEALREGLVNENNPNRVRVLCADAMDLQGLDGSFGLVTLVGSTARESGQGLALLEKALALVKPGGSLYLQTVTDAPEWSGEAVDIICQRAGVEIVKTHYDPAYDLEARFFKIVRR